jgi:hypothetical protein
MFPNYFIFNNNSLIMQLKRLTSRGTTGASATPNQLGDAQTKTSFTNLNVEELIAMQEPANFNIEGLDHKGEHNLEMYKTFSDFSLAAHHIMEEINRRETPSNTTDKFTLNSINSLEPRIQFRHDTSSFFNMGGGNDKVMESLFLTRNVSFGFGNKTNTTESINPYTFMENKNSEIRMLFSDPSRTLTVHSVSKPSEGTRSSGIMQPEVVPEGKCNNIGDLMMESKMCLTRLISKEYKKPPKVERHVTVTPVKYIDNYRKKKFILSLVLTPLGRGSSVTIKIAL